MDDIVPGLLETIENQFDERTYKSAKLKKTLRSLKDRKATYLDANEFAIEVGEILADVLSTNITAEVLPDGKMYFNIADRILNPTLKKNYDLISGYSGNVQTLLNKAADLHLKTQIPKLNQDRIDGIINRISSGENFDEIKWILDDPIINFSQSIVDEAIEKNAKFHSKSGLAPKLVRRVYGHACDWCRDLAGTYDYRSAPKDIYRRHERCHCTVDYVPKEGKRQDVWSKQWKDTKKDAKIEERKAIGLSEYLSTAGGAKNYFRDSSEDNFFSADEIRKLDHAYRQYDAIKNGNQALEKRKIYSNISQFKIMSGFSKSDVDVAFNHVFNDIHELGERHGLFVPDYDMAQSWSRLIAGRQVQKHDLILLLHERLEHDYMYRDKLDYNTAHKKTSEKFNYVEALKKYYKGGK